MGATEDGATLRLSTGWLPKLSAASWDVADADVGEVVWCGGPIGDSAGDWPFAVEDVGPETPGTALGDEKPPRVKMGETWPPGCCGIG
jgi:hypothetical protein